MKNQMKKIALTLAALGLVSAGAANAGVASTTIAMTGTVVASCSVSSTAAAFSNTIAAGSAGVTAPVTVNVNCSSGTPWQVRPSVNGVSYATVGADSTSNQVRLEKLDGTPVSYSALAPAALLVTGTGTGAVQAQSLQMHINNLAIVGTGAISGSYGIDVVY